MSAKYKSPSFLLPNELNTSANTANDTGINSLYSMDLDGGNKYIDCGTGLGDSLGTYIGDLSFSFWINRPTAANSKGILYFGPFNNRGVLEIYADTNTITLYINGNTKTISYTNTNTWDNICIIYKSGDISNSKIYLNGSEPTATDTGSFPSSLSFAGEKTIIGGYYSSAYTFNGKIDEVAIFNKALNTTEIAALYEGTSPNIYPSNLIASNLNPIAYYPLGEQAQNTGYLDPNNPGNDISGSEWQFPNGVLQDYVMDFDGSTDFIDIDSSSFGSNSFSISLWFKQDSGTGFQGLFAGSGYSGGTGFIIYTYQNTVKIYTAVSGSTTNILTSPTFSFNTWYNVLLKREYNVGWSLYIDGTQVDTYSSLTTTDLTSANTRIGRHYNNSSLFFNGQMSNVVVWNSDQSANIANIYNNGSPQTSYTVSPQNWWKLNADSVYTPSAPNYTTALDFNGSSDYIDFGNDSSLNISTSSYSISFWIKTNDPGTAVLSQKANNELAVFIASSKIQWNGPNTFFSTSTITGDVWKHICLVTNSSNSYIYINGVQDATVSNSQINSSTTSDNFRIGGRSTQFNYDGQFSNYALYNTDLSASQVSTLFNFGTPETNISFSPQAWWKLDDQTAITDSSGNGNTGTNNGAADSPGGVAVTPSWKIPSALPITTTPSYTQALNFSNGSGTGSYTDSIAYGSSFSDVPSASDAHTFSLWFKQDTLNSNEERLFATKGGWGGLALWIDNGTLKWSVYDGGNRVISTSIQAGIWYNIVFGVNGSNETFLYLNNGSKISTAYSGTISYNNSETGIYLGRGRDNAPDRSLNGQLSNFAWFNYVLPETGTESIESIYNLGTPKDITGWSNNYLWYKLNSTTITDSSGNNRTGVNSNATLVSSDVLATQPVNGVSTTLPSTALQQSDLQFDSPYSNYSLSFDGTGDYIDTGSASYLNGLSKFSISCWFKLDTAANQNTIISDWLYNQAGGKFALQTTDSSGSDFALLIFIRNSSSDAGSNTAKTSRILTEGNWYNVIFSFNSGSCQFYINGSPVTTTITGTIPSNLWSEDGNLNIGKFGGTLTRYWNGKLDETSIFNTELTSAQVLEIYNNGRPKDLSTFSGTAPVSWWRLGENAYFDNNSFIVPNSISGSSNGTGFGTVTSMLSADAPGTYANGVGTDLDIVDRIGNAALSTANSQSYNMIPDDKIPYVPGYVGLETTNNSEFTFDPASNTRFEVAYNTSFGFGTSGFTISLWINFNSLNSNGYNILDFRSSGGPSNVGSLWINSVNGLRWFVSNTYLANLNIPAASFSNSTWYHICVANSGSTTSFYLNGALIDSASDTTNYAASPLVIGDYFGGNYVVDGKMDEIAIFDKALTADQIEFDLYKPTSEGTNQTADIANNPNLPNPVAWYRMGD